jgi:hypothetical protein
VQAVGDVVFVGGSYEFIGGARRWFYAMVDPVTGAALQTTLDATAPVYVTLVRPGSILVGGAFSALGGWPRSGLAEVTVPTVLGSPVASESTNRLRLSASPNPARHGVRIAFDLPRPSRIRLTIHDIQGRRVFDRRWTQPVSGPATLAVDTGGWRHGVYWARLEAAGETGTVQLLHLP